MRILFASCYAGVIAASAAMTFVAPTPAQAGRFRPHAHRPYAYTYYWPYTYTYAYRPYRPSEYTSTSRPARGFARW
jgi:hypothetical protein